MFPPVAQGGAGDRPVGDTVARAQQTTGPATTTLWPLAPAQPNQLSNQQFQGIPPLAATPAPAHNQGVNRSGTLYSLFSGGGGGSYVAATPATPGQSAAARTYHKVSESVFSAAVGVGMSGYTWGAPTPPPGSPYSPVPMTQLDLLKNFANLAPAAAAAAAANQQTLSLQGVGVNVAGSLHHAQHTQHTQHTLNLTGFHHLHHGGLHQNAFSPQLSLVAGSAPTLTINSFSSHNPTGNGVAPTTGVLLQEYQSPIGATAAPAGCTVTVNGSSCLTNTSSTANSMVLHGGSGGGNQATGNQTVQAATVTTKKREAFLSSQGQPVKLENKSTRTSCLCRNSNGKTKIVHSDVGCSRTLPVASSWNGQDGNASTNNSNAASLTVKREPLASVPCQVAEVSTSLHATTTSVKIEPVPPKSENGIAVPNVGKAVGIAVARQRLQHQETSSMRNVSLSHHTSHHATNYHHFQPDSLGSGTAMTIGGTTLVHCGGPGGEDRAAHLAAIPSGALAPSLNLNSSINSALNSTLGSIGGAPAAATDAAAATWPPTLWQYSATAAAAMPEPVGFSQMGSGLQGGFQLIRDPTTGQILVITAEQMQQAVVFPNYLNHSNNVIPSSLLVPPPPSSIQLLSDIGGARLVLTENKRKQQSASLPIVKIEAECSNSPTAIITSTESSKTALQTMTGALVPDAALVTTLYYPQGPALVQISQSEPTAHCRSQATSPVSCLTPPPEIPATIHAVEPASFGVQDASNQTDAPEETDEHKQEPPLVKQEQNLSPCQASQSGGANLTAANFEIVRITTTTTTVNPTVCGIVAKVDKAENTIINMADAAKYLTKGSGRGNFVRAIEQNSQGVKATDEDKEDKVPLCNRSRIGARIIEITEENCDSFHENLEFFARRRDISADQRNHRDDYSKDETDAAPNIHEKMDIDKIIDAPENVEVHCQMCPKIPETAIFDETKPSAVDSTKSSIINCESCDKNRNIANGEDRPQIAKKSFDMPNIDCDDQEVQQVVIKQEADDNCYEVCYESSRCEPTSTSERSRSSCERLSQEGTKRHSVEKTHHPGIENVVEKLKKSAAALQEATLPAVQKIDKSTEQLDAEKLRRYSETIPKKLHFLRSCQNSLESNLDTEVSSSQTAEQHDHDQSGHSLQMEDEPSSASSKCDTSGECLINDNNNDSKSNNNNIKVLEDVKLLAMNKKNILYDTYKPKTVWRCEVHPLGKFNATRKSEVVKDDASSETIDNSGLLLLSKSIEQHEQRIGQPEHPQPDAYDAENSSVRSELQMSQQSESNNVGNRLRILDLAQIASEIIESDHLEKDGNKRKYPENDDHQVKRYKIDDCKEEETDKDASFNYREESIANKTMEIIAERRAEESTKCIVNFSEEKINNVTDERVTDAEEKPLNEDYANYQPKKRNAKLLNNSQVPNKICLDETFNNSQNNDNYNKLSDEGSDNESKISSGQPMSQVESKKRKASVEDARGDVHDYKNPQTKLETKKFIARKGSRDEGDWPNINATESNIIAKMANIQKKYKEKLEQLELFKLPPKKDDKKCFGRSRKKSHSSVSSDQGTLPSPPAYEFGSSPNSPVKLSGWIDDAFLPITSAGSIVPTNGTNLEKHLSKIERKSQIEHQSHIKLLDSIPSIPKSELPIALPEPMPGPSKTAEDGEKNTGTATVNSDTSSSSSAAISISASKRRKVGRPRKFQNLTETIVNKKSKSKSAIVDYVLSPKNRHLQTKQYGYTPLPFKSSISSLRQSKVRKMKRMKQTHNPLHKKDVIVSSIFGDKAKKHSSGKVKPKLKAEVKMKNLKNDENDTIPPENIPSEESIVQNSIEETPAESIEQETEKEPERPRHEKSKKRKRKLSQSSNSESRESNWHKNCTQCKKAAAESIIRRCKLTDEYLKQDHLRILKESNGLFYAGTLSIVQDNEIYAINLDGERGNKSHILPKEDILRDAIVEVRPSSTKEILPGTRLCAYWSHNQRCLYPGISAEPINPEQCKDNDVIVEFDDGDSGRINLERIRFLLPDYPFVEYNTNPLVSCRKRRRQASTSEEKRSVDNDQTAASGDEVTAEASTHERGKTKIEKLCDYHRRKKKTKKDKKLHESQEEKLKHRKHKSSKEHRKERHKHKKHRKHKHRHHDSFGDSSKMSKESSFEQKSEEEAAHNTNKDFFAAVEKMSFEAEESEDNEPQVASEELLESGQEDEEAQIESEESAEAIEDEEEAQMPEAIQEDDAVQIESKESSDLVEESDEVQIQESQFIQDVQVKSEESPASIQRKLRKQRKTSTNRTSTSRVSTNRPLMNRVSTRRAAKTNLVTSTFSTDVTASTSSSSNSSSSNSSSSNSSSSNSSSSNSSSSNSSSSSSSSTSSSLSNPPLSNPPSTSSSAPDSSASNPIETTSAIAPMLPNKRLWKWASKPDHTSGGNQYYTAIRRGRETINIGDSVLFYSYKPNEKPYIGKIVQLWSKKSEMKVKCDWFYRPEELHEPCRLDPPGGLFTSDHRDTNDVQTISHKVMVVSLDEYKQMLEKTPQRHQRICEDDTYYYRAGYYKNPKMKLATGVKTIPIQTDNK